VSPWLKLLFGKGGAFSINHRALVATLGRTAPPQLPTVEVPDSIWKVIRLSGVKLPQTLRSRE